MRNPAGEAQVPPDQARVLWLGLLSGPVIYSVYFLAGYLLVDIACQANLLAYTVLGLSLISVVVLGLTLVALALSLYASFVTYRRWQRMRGTFELDDEHRRLTEGPEQFMTFGGLLLNALFAFLILVTGISALVLWPCGWI
ncbi:MAG TPA: hypothetical protein VF177_16010 [Anaerolineae bacterium]